MNQQPRPIQTYLAECIGTAFLLAVVVGSGIMAESLAGGNVALALLGNTLPTGAILFVLITFLGPISGAHFNPAVTFTFWMRREIPSGDAIQYVIAQVIGAILGVLVAHLMFDLDVLQTSTKFRNGGGQWFSEWVATFGLIFTILGTMAVKREAGNVSGVVYHCGLLVHGVYIVCESGGDHRAQHDGQLLRYISGPCTGVYRHAAIGWIGRIDRLSPVVH